MAKSARAELIKRKKKKKEKEKGKEYRSSGAQDPDARSRESVIHLDYREQVKEIMLMLKVRVVLDNMTTDEDTIELELPMEESTLRSKLMSNCEYLITGVDGRLIFENCEDIFAINKIVNRISLENPAIDNIVLNHILNATKIMYIDDETILDQICENDFMYEEAYVPLGWKGSEEEFAAYYLFVKYKIPFSIYDIEMQDLSKVDTDYDGWDIVWDVYSYMGFCISIDEQNEGKIYIINIENSKL